MKTMLFVDDHPIYRDGLQRLLSDALPELSILLAPDTSSARVIINDCRELDLCLSDQKLNDGTGLELLASIRRSRPSIATGVLCAELTIDLVKKAKAIGAVACLSKDRDAEGIVTAIRAIFDGACVFDLPKTSTPEPLLTTRRLQVLSLASQGQSDRQIADRLQVSESAIRSHWEAIFEKLGSSNRTEAVTMAVRQGVI